MPYIPPKDRPELDPYLDVIRKKVVDLSDKHEKMVKATWGYMRYIAKKVMIEAALTAAEQYQGKRQTRYWLIVDHDGVPMNVARELYRRVSVHQPEGREMFNFQPFDSKHLPEVPADAVELDPEINALLQGIAKISGPKSLTGGYDYDGAYCGMVNYSMTELMPRILLSAFEANSRNLQWSDIEALICFWLSIANELYQEIAYGYEDEQIAKNGDVPIYGMLLKHLREQ